jgi:uncharacterized protein (DUF4415 family)
MPRKKLSRSAPATKDRTDWTRVRSFTENDIERMAAADEENPATTEADWAQAFVGLPPRKTRIHASLDSDVVNWFRQQGPGYQTRMNAVLRRYMAAQQRKTG